MHDQFAARLNTTRSHVGGLVNHFAKGAIDADQFGDRLYDLLVAAHSDAYKLGMLHGGTDIEPLALQTLSHQHGRDMADKDNTWLEKFVNDLAGDRYLDPDGTLKTAAVAARAQMYASKIRASGNQGFVDASVASNPVEEFIWELGSEAPCRDCPRLAALSPYKADELFTVPGEGDTACLSNCACRLIRSSDGRAGFTL